MAQAIDPIKLKAAAEHLEWVLRQYPDAPAVQALLASLTPIIVVARAGRVVAPCEPEQVPGVYDFANGLYVPFKNPDVGDAYAAFRIELSGGLSQQDEQRLARMEAMRMKTRKAAVCVALALVLTSCATTEGQGAVASSSDQTYPVALWGAWMPEAGGCPRPLAEDSETLLSIEPGLSGQYENTARPLKVQQVSRDPPTWKILSTSSTGTAEYEGQEWIGYVLRGDRLTISKDGAESTFIRCM